LWNRGNDDPGRRFLIENDPALGAARLALAGGVAQVIGNGLALMGVEPAEEMR
jgi:arginyl-tRNA synthetase